MSRRRNPPSTPQRWLARLGRFAELLDGHLTEWMHLWERLSIEFDDFTDELRILRLHLLHLLQTVSPNTAGPRRRGAGPRAAWRGVSRPHLLGRAVHLPGAQPAAARWSPGRCSATVTGACRKPVTPPRRPATRARCFPGSPAATDARKANGCTSIRAAAAGTPTPAHALTTSVSPSPTTRGSSTRSPATSPT